MSENQQQSGSESFHGVLGDLVRAIEPHTEADPMAILVQGLVAFGNIVGRKPHFQVEANRHGMNLFACFVGRSSKSRKGTSWGHVNRCFERSDASWDERVASGLSSGEGLIAAVCDGNRKAKIAPVIDKRLLVMESEFASVLRVMGRDGNTLSTQLRRAWDGDRVLRVLNKNSPLRATDTHISLISHISQPELRRYLTATEMGNGFANRFLWCSVSRSKLLPEGGRLDDKSLSRLDRRLGSAIDFSMKVGRIERDDEARRLWRQVYAELTADQPGLFGAVTSRAEAQVTRLSCLYALLDKSAKVVARHLTAALALWRYCEASAKQIFGDALGDPIADELLRALRCSAKGLTRTEISNAFGRHLPAQVISVALETLRELGLASVRPETTQGRPIERWTAGAKEAKKAKEGASAAA